jgi:HemY protein
MLWSLLKFILFIAIIAALTIGASYLMETGGGIRIAVGTVELNLGPLQAVLAVLLLLVAVWLVLKIAGLIVALVRFINGDETAITRWFDRNRERKGIAALTEGIMAVASGDGRLALSKAARAEKLLHRPELTNLVLAQAAELSGDPRRAEAAYRRLLRDDRTRFVGIRGLLKQKLAEGDTDTALALARHAFALKPQNVEVQDTLLTLQAQTQDWTGARATLAEKARMGFLPRDVVRRRDAVLALSEAKAVMDAEISIEAREAAIAANRMSPDLIPAAVMASEGYVADGNRKYATRVLKKAWESRPHPDLAAAFAAIEPDETPEARLKRFEVLTRLNPDDPETRMLRAELAIGAGDFPEARRAIGKLVETDPTSRGLALMAAIARGEGADDAVVRGWLTRALVAPRGPQWVCDSCGHVHDRWMPVCSTCGGFDTLSWKRPEAKATPMPGSAEMLPLIVGTSVASAPRDEPSEAAESGVPEPEDVR